MRRDRRRRVVLTGAWGGGKSTLIQELLADPDYAGSILILPEVAPLARSMGFNVRSESFEKCVFDLQHALERVADMLETEDDTRVVIAHRGTLDALAFWCYGGGEQRRFFDVVASSLDAEMDRYDAVILLRSTAQGLPDVYENHRRRFGRPTAEEAIRLESLLECAWEAHPRFFSIGNDDMPWHRKSALAKAIVDACSLPQRQVSRQTLNAHLDQIRYPSSHRYTIDEQGRVNPAAAGESRVQEIERILPERQWQSLIDVGCAKGMFLLWAIQRYGLRRAIGVEAAKDMVVTCREAVDFLNAPATILHGSLDGLYRGLPPADLVFVLHCYHHLYFGSAFGTPAVPSHDRWFEILAGISSDVLVFANPLHLESDKKEMYRKKGFSDQVIQDYNAEAILGTARRYFDLEQFSLGGERPYILMKKVGA